MKQSVKLRNIILIVFIVLVCIVLTLLTLFRSKSITSLMPELKDLQATEIDSYELFIYSKDYSRYAFVSDKNELDMLSDKINIMSIRRNFSSAPKSTSSTNIKINMKDGSAKYLTFYGERNYIPNTKYHITTYVRNLLFSKNDTDIKCSINNTNFCTLFKSDSEGVFAIKTTSDLDSYFSTLEYTQDGIYYKNNGEDNKEYYKKVYNEEFFQTQALIIANVPKTEYESSLEFDSIKINDDKLTLRYNYFPSVQNSAVNSKTLALHLFEINLNSVSNITEYEISKHDLTEIDFVKEVINKK